ncbi:MAG: 5'-nucleotidase C-terminal domain-containing protein [Bacteroidales bacterium]|nr:5'-nucleotidase C-terminal domain-containing protein [Bacteroidales bacterium]
MKKLVIAALTAISLAACGPKDGEYTFHLLTTNDIHGTYFDSTYINSDTRNSLIAVKAKIDELRGQYGKDNVILIDDGDFLQGDNAAYYFNYVDTTSKHIFSRMAEYMEYDAVVAGNHDIETGHAVYDRVTAELNAAGIPFLAGNAIRNDNGERYFPEYTIIKRNGLKIAVLGYDNANISAWLNESLWSGMKFHSLTPLVQEDVDRIIAKEKPHAVIVAVHSGNGNGDGKVLESQGLDLFQSLHDVDFLICAHDHRANTVNKEDICLINSGSHSRNLGHGTLNISVKKGKVVAKSIDAELIPIDKSVCDEQMKAMFHDDYLKVKAFTLREIGSLATPLYSRQAFAGMSDFINLIHTISLKSSGAQVSFAAPLSQNGIVNAGTLIYNDLFTIYPYENQLYKIKMSGKEIVDCLEYSYDAWIQNPVTGGGHVLKITNRPDSRNGNRRWSFIGTSFNFDSAGGLNYTVDVTKPYGERVKVTSLADGTAFSLDEQYSVALTSYRASGGGDILKKGAGIDVANINDRVIDTYPEIRNLLYDFIQEHGELSSEIMGDKALLGDWYFAPKALTAPLLAHDLELLFGE